MAGQTEAACPVYGNNKRAKYFVLGSLNSVFRNRAGTNVVVDAAAVRHQSYQNGIDFIQYCMQGGIVLVKQEVLLAALLGAPFMTLANQGAERAVDVVSVIDATDIDGKILADQRQAIFDGVQAIEIAQLLACIDGTDESGGAKWVA